MGKELQIWACTFCGFDENAPQATRCLGCLQETRYSQTMGKNLKAVLKSMLRMTTTCPHTKLEDVEISVAAHEATGPITQTKLWRSATKLNQRLAVKEVLGKDAGTPKERKIQERRMLTEIQLEPERFLELLPRLSEKTQRQIQQQ